MSSHATHTNHGTHVPPILLTIAGFDPSCGAGVAADLKTFAAHNCYGVAAVTALTVQSTQGVLAVQVTPSATLRAQLDALAEDSAIAGVKIGMLGNRANAAVVAEFLDKHKFAHVVLDPVSRPTAGDTELLDAPGLKFVRDELLKRASVITPNIPEAEFLTGLEVKDVHGMKAAGQKLLEMGARAVIVTGGHLDKADRCAVRWNRNRNVRRRSREEPEHAWIRMHVFVGDRGAAGERSAVARSRDSGEGVRDESDREVVSDRQRRWAAEPAFPIPPGSRRRAVSTKCRNTECIPPQSLPRSS